MMKIDENLIGKVLAGLNGAAGIVGMSNGLNRIDNQPQSQFRNAMNGYENAASSIGNYDDLVQGYNNLIAFQQQSPSYGDIRGSSTGEQIGTGISAALSGAEAGNMIGGPIGAAIGGVIGGGFAALQAVNGNKSARLAQETMRLDGIQAMQRGIANANAAAENLADKSYRSNIGNIGALGGTMRRQMSIDEFSKNLLDRRQKRYYGTQGIIRQRCNGGLMIRIKK